MAVPNLCIRIFMSPTNAILSIAPAIIRCYAPVSYTQRDVYKRQG